MVANVPLTFVWREGNAKVSRVQSGEAYTAEAEEATAYDVIR